MEALHQYNFENIHRCGERIILEIYNVEINNFYEQNLVKCVNETYFSLLNNIEDLNIVCKPIYLH